MHRNAILYSNEAAIAQTVVLLEFVPGIIGFADNIGILGFPAFLVINGVSVFVGCVNGIFIYRFYGISVFISRNDSNGWRNIVCCQRFEGGHLQEKREC